MLTLSLRLRGFFPQKSNLIDKVEKLEKEFFTTKSEISWNEEDFINSIPKSEDDKINFVEKDITEKRRITEQEIQRWFNPNSSYSKFLSVNLEKSEFEEFYELLQQASSETIFDWHTIIGFVKIG